MALGSFGLGFSIGFGTGLLAREALPIAREMVEPVVRVAARTGVYLFERSREAFARAGETLADLVAEVNAELSRGERKVKTKKMKAKKRKRGKLAEVTPLRRVA
jgi:hypothetical protein